MTKPAKTKQIHMMLRLTPDQLKAVDERAARDNRTRSNWISTLVARSTRDEIASKIGDQWVVWR